VVAAVATLLAANQLTSATPAPAHTSLHQIHMKQDPNSPFEIVSIAAIHAILQPVVAASLAADGFEEAGPLKWVRSADAPVRQVFSFQQWKGGVLAPSWGLSLDFVPHVSGSRIKWHRTPRSAMLDLRVDAREPALELPYHHGTRPIVDRAADVVAGAVARARALWAMGHALDDLIRAFDWTKKYYAATPGLGFYNFVQHPVALAFTYARLGKLAEANRELDEYWTDRDELKAELRRLVADAAPAGNAH